MLSKEVNNTTIILPSDTRLATNELPDKSDSVLALNQSFETQNVSCFSFYNLIWFMKFS